MSLSVTAIVSSEVAATASSAQGAHQGHDKRRVSSRCAIVPINAPSCEGLQLIPVSEQLRSGGKLIKGKFVLLACR
jgi:hypothetical protein